MSFDEHVEAAQAQTVTTIARRDPGEMAAAEMAAAAVAEQERSQVQARYALARQFPRDWDNVRIKMVATARRPSFAAVARYVLRFGKTDIIGPSIRFAEEAVRCMGNLYIEPKIVFDDRTRRVYAVSVTDLESNVTYKKDVVIEKTVERRKADRGQTVLGSRRNSFGDLLYIVEATSDEVRNKEGAEISKAIRDNVLRHLPGDIREEALAEIEKTVADKAAKDPAGERKKLADAFATKGVMPEQLKEYLGHDFGSCSPEEIIELQAIYVGIKDGEIRWHDLMRERAAANGQAEAPPEEVKPTGPATRKVDSIKERLRAKSAAAKKPAEPQPAEEQREPGSDEDEA